MSWISIAHTVRKNPRRAYQVCRDLFTHLGPVIQFLEERRQGSHFSLSEGSLTVEELRFLKDLVDETAGTSGPLIEIGTLLGATSSRMAMWKRAEQRIVTVDNYSWGRWGLTPETQFELVALVLRYWIEAGDAVQIRANKDEWFAAYDGPEPTLVFCDAVHTYQATAADIAWARRIGARQIAGHDYAAEHPGVVQAVVEAGGPDRLVGSLWTLPAAV